MLGDVPKKKILSLSIPIEDTRELVLAIAVNTAAIETVLDRYGAEFTRIERVDLETAAMFGESMVTMLSLVAGLSQADLVRAMNGLAGEISDIHNTDTDNLFVHANKSKDGKDFLIKKIFGTKDT